ncbi:MAG: methyltransferase [Pseudomonadota bacterium]|nr:methyltransferase [Pseudomonadota bacterium]
MTILLGVAANSGVFAQASDSLQTAVDNPLRTPAYVARDPARHPLQTLRFFGLQPAMTVVELSPGGGWYSEILAGYLRDSGRLVLAADDPESVDVVYRRSAARFTTRLAAKPTLYDRAVRSVFESPRELNFVPPGTADLVLTFRNVHNWAAEGDDAVSAVFAAVHRSLKPGGVFGVVDHRLPPSMPQDAKASSGYLHTAYVVKLAEAAGFRLDASSEINANPKDTADHAGGVWALPPSYANKDVDRTRYAAIGESDRMTLRFVRVP